MKTRSLPALLVFFAGLTSCLNLQNVHQFSEEALESAATFQQVELTFQQLCKKKHLMEAIRHSAVQRSYEGNCKVHFAADSAILKMQQVVTDYLNGLFLLTANKRITYALDPLAEAIQANALINVQEEETAAYQKMLELLMQASTEAYRKKKAAAYISQAQESLTVLLDQLIFVLDKPLREAAAQQQEMLYLQTRELADSAQSFLEKRSLILDYAGQLEYYQQQQQLLNTYITMLHRIREGHRQLYEKRDQLNKDDVLETLLYYTGELRQLQSEFKKIR